MAWAFQNFSSLKIWKLRIYNWLVKITFASFRFNVFLSDLPPFSHTLKFSPTKLASSAYHPR